jgi:hypothetical protein
MIYSNAIVIIHLILELINEFGVGEGVNISETPYPIFAFVT